MLGDLKKYFEQRGSRLFVLLAAFSAVHIVMIAAVNIPSGPLHSALQSLSQNYIDPIFEQDWRLFAPTPKIHNIGYLIRVRYDDNNNVSPWVDITTSAVNEKLADPLLPRKEYDLLESVDLQLSNWESEDLSNLRSKRISDLSPEEWFKHRDDEDYRYKLVPITAEEEKLKKVAEMFAFNVLIDYAKREFSPGFRAVQLRTVDIPPRPPEFDHELDARGRDEPITRLDSDWLKVATP